MRRWSLHKVVVTVIMRLQLCAARLDDSSLSQGYWDVAVSEE